MTCAEKLSFSAYAVPVVNSIPTVISFTDQSRPRFWYAVIADCSAQQLEAQYQITFLNPGGAWSRQFSFEEQGLVGMHLAFFLFFVIGVSAHLYGVWQFHKSNSFHPLIRLLTSSILMEFVSIMCYFIHYAIYADNGVGAPGLKGLAEILHMAAVLLLMLLLLLIAKGWAITSNYLTDKNFLVVVISLFLLAYIALFIWDNVGRDPASTIYFYDSVPGIIVICLRVVTLVWFLWYLWKTYQLETLPEKRKFYIYFGVVYVIWFVALPIIVIIAAALSPWVREKIVTGLTLSINSLAFLALGFLLWPSRASEYFSIKPAGALLDQEISSGGGAYGSSTSGQSLIHDDNL